MIRLVCFATLLAYASATKCSQAVAGAPATAFVCPTASKSVAITPDPTCTGACTAAQCCRLPTCADVSPTVTAAVTCTVAPKLHNKGVGTTCPGGTCDVAQCCEVPKCDTFTCPATHNQKAAAATISCNAVSGVCDEATCCDPKVTATTTLTPWDSSASSSGASDSLASSYSGDPRLAGSSAYDDSSSGSTGSGSSGSYLKSWQWLLLLIPLLLCLLLPLLLCCPPKKPKKKAPKPVPAPAPEPEPVVEPLMPVMTTAVPLMPSYSMPATTAYAAPTTAYAAPYTTGYAGYPGMPV